MRIGNRRISGISARFWVILGVTAFIVIAAVAFAPTPPVSNPGFDPAFAPTELRAAKYQKDTWLDPYVSYFGAPHYVTQIDDLLGDGYLNLINRPVRVRAYIPDSAQSDPVRPDLKINKYGLTCEAGLFLNPTSTYTEEDLSALGDSQSQGDTPVRPLQLCFRQSQVPVPGQAYELTGILYWRSDLVSPPADAANAPDPSPTLLIANAKQLSNDELRAPSTHRVNLNLVYTESPYTMVLRSLEWSSGHELRACVYLRNDDTRPHPVWSGITGSDGLDGVSSDNGTGKVTGAPSTDSPLTKETTLSPGQSIYGYIIFNDPTASDPSKPLKLVMPELNSGTVATPEQVIVQIPQKEIKDVTQSNTGTSGCGNANPGTSPESAGNGAAASDSSSSVTPAAGSGTTAPGLFPDQGPVN